ncbi:unnamed protein product [Anisakis simplex]|uniref:Na_H_Exchanger domain-containing protein n=1 Tax=Anisakis simplex TaxID=6269 RepID=A0A0M3KJD6_ANISI|nr:unnamed protein product [Anisakis simplex]
MWYIPEKGSKNVHFARLAVLGQLALLALFGCETLGFDSTGPIAILVGAFVAATQWKKEYSSDVEQEVTLDEEKAMALMWTFFFQPLLFTLIGFELDFGNVCLLSTFTFFTLAQFCQF